MTVSVGIDLGTTFSVVAIVDPKTGIPQIVPNIEGNKITPSVIQFLDGRAVFGSEAESAFNSGEPNCVATFKRAMGKNESYCEIDGKLYTAEDLSSLLLRHLKDGAEASLGKSITDAVITVPAYFYSYEREVTIRAAERAGLTVKKIIDEPCAAAMMYGLNNWRENANILVYDLGGGTFDVTLIHMGYEGQLETITTNGNHELGGKDWDDRLEMLLLEKFSDETDVDIVNDISIKAMLRGMTENVKKQLSAMNATKVTATIPNFGVTSITVTRQEFEERTADLIDRTGDLCQAVLNEVGLSAKDVTDVLLVGGSTKMPQVPRYLLELFGKSPIAHVNPDEAVALGAAIQATKSVGSFSSLSVIESPDGKKIAKHTTLSTNAKVKPPKRLSVQLLKLQENTAHAMGVAAIDDDNKEYYNEVIIPQNHPRPVKYAKKFRFLTDANSKNEMEIYVLQGEKKNPLDCQLQYKYIVSGIEYFEEDNQLGTVMRIQYSYNEHGIICIQARQGEKEQDLPIQKAEITHDDIAMFKQPIKKNNANRGSFLSSLIGNTQNNQKIVHKYKEITFSNVNWEKYDNISSHPCGAEYNEPKIHVIANQKKIEFHGYNISEMDEGVTYRIDAQDDFEIECNINTSTIQPHPGGNVKISVGIISANLDENGGKFFLDGKKIKSVGSKFKLKMSLTDGGHYQVYVDGKCVGDKNKPTSGHIDVLFGFVHPSHHCSSLSRAYISDIKMLQSINKGTADENVEVSTWD